MTNYVYGTTLADSGIARSDLLRAEIYPDSDDTASPLGDGPDGVYDRIEYSYNRQGEQTELEDQRETVHAFGYDALGRQTEDRITTLGSGVDGTVRRIATTYEVRGLRERITSYNDPTVGAGLVVNEVEFAYNGFGQLVTEYQEHNGAVNTTTSPKVQYGYADGANNHVRQTSVTYPSGRTISYGYGAAGSADDAASRVQAINDGTLSLAEYSYLGRQTFVEVDYTEPEVKYTFVDLAGSNDADTGDVYSGFDRFGRIKDSRWYDYAGLADVDRIKYGYDRASNQAYREAVLDGNDAHDELYAYDGAHRLSEFDRGSLNSAKDVIIRLKFAQRWSLDGTGNWASFNEDKDGDGVWDLDQNRSHNPINEVTDISETAGPSWMTPAYDRAGNMTTIPQPADPTRTYSGVWDGWNRLVKLVNDGTSGTIQEREYDGRRFQVVRKDYSGGALDEIRHIYYTSDWQAVEERLGSSSDSDRQFVWGGRYIDDLVLRDRDTSGNGTLDERFYAMQDGNWNVAAVADGSGTVQERYAYTAYGEPGYLDASYTARSGSSYDWGYLYTGRFLDSTSSLYCYRNRMYDPKLGRFCSRDPIGYVDSGNMYECISGNPTRGVDPHGTDFMIKEEIVGTNTVEIYFNGTCCWKRVRDACGTIIESGTRVKCPNAPGSNTPLDELEFDNIVDAIAGAKSIIDMIQEIRKGAPGVDPRTPGPYTPHLERLIVCTVKGLGKFSKEGGPCRKWYKEAIRTILAAAEGNCSKCATLQTNHPPSGSTNADRCWEELLNTGTTTLPSQFADLTRKVATGCKSLCDK